MEVTVLVENATRSPQEILLQMWTTQITIGAKIVAFYTMCHFLSFKKLQFLFKLWCFFHKRDVNYPSFRQKRKKNHIVPRKSSGKPFSPRLQTRVLKRMVSGVESKMEGHGWRWRKSFGETFRKRPLHQHRGFSVKILKRIYS